jgi:ribosome maturation factor RimP
VPVNNQRRWKGVIQAVNGDEITLATDHGEAKLKFSALSDARLVLTDKLIEDDLRRAKAAEAAGEQTADEG